MELLFFILIALFVVAGFLYCMTMLWFAIGWVSLKEENQPASEIKVTIVVAARNESETIENCLNSILAQTYPHSLKQIIVVDDSSEDDTAVKVRRIAERNPTVQLLSLSNEGKTGKKSAIEFAVSKASGELIITTDADC
ncbi:MAG: glycosyltransferase, partial [Bacteroidota bacterium]|nr:glycosyltransferase [Bacteroidota bacterium]